MKWQGDNGGASILTNSDQELRERGNLQPHLTRLSRQAEISKGNLNTRGDTDQLKG